MNTEQPTNSPEDLRAEIAKLVRWHQEDGAEMTKMRATITRLRARVAELERPAVEAKRGEVQLSMRQLAAQAREDGDYEGEATVLQRLADREEQWKTEDATASEATR